MQLVESAINDLAFAAIALYFLYALPGRIVRGRLLELLHRLRSLACVGKVAALCAEESQDAVVLATVTGIENLTTDMSRQIWQKISLLPR